jgi:hydrogenase maturation protein HypF
MTVADRGARGTVGVRLRVTGTVQGVGFRPFVYRLAHEEALAGHVLNDERGVVVEIEGPAGSVEHFMARLGAELPALARIDSVTREGIAPRGTGRFEIRESTRTGAPDAPITPDSAPCAQCLSELGDPADRRYRYPFINCTNCGPRFTIVRGVPYDRPLTTMAPFAMCAECRQEYEDPLDRRFHAQPNACPECGPRLRVLDSSGAAVALDAAEDPVQWAAARLAAGAIVAVKGLGGYHLVCDASDARAVEALRARKHREDKPFALMVPSTDHARGLVALDEDSEALLRSRQRPIVLAPRLAVGRLATAVAPGAPELGVMLPYTPLHALLLSDFLAERDQGPGALVMTSGNVSDEPIAYRDTDALQRLGAIADFFLIHDREIETRTDDSVLRTVRTGESGGPRSLFLRRSRGYVPGHLSLPQPARTPLLACGAEQKNTFCVARGERAWVGHHIGDLEHYPTLRAFEEGIDHFQRLFAVTPEVVVHDLHPDYLSTRYALEREGVRTVGVQHHHAHLAACLAEHGAGDRPAVGAIFDGTGYGPDATVWGGELLIGDLRGFERAGWLLPVRMPGAAAAIRQPWRMASAWLSEAFGEPQPLPPALAHAVEPSHWQAMAQVAASPAVSPLTSSIGRLFDAVGAICGLGAAVSYEGQAAVELEAAAWKVGGWVPGSYELELIDADAGTILDPCPAIRAIVADLARGIPVPTVSARFHHGLARATTAVLIRLARERDLDTAVLSGGVFQNRLLLEQVATATHAAGLEVLIPAQLPPNDGGISFGQAAVAAGREAAGASGADC